MLRIRVRAWTRAFRAWASVFVVAVVLMFSGVAGAREALVAAATATHADVVIVGGSAGSGKTTFHNAMIALAAAEKRPVWRFDDFAFLQADYFKAVKRTPPEKRIPGQELGNSGFIYVDKARFVLAPGKEQRRFQIAVHKMNAAIERKLATDPDGNRALVLVEFARDGSDLDLYERTMKWVRPTRAEANGARIHYAHIDADLETRTEYFDLRGEKAMATNSVKSVPVYDKETYRRLYPQAQHGIADALGKSLPEGHVAEYWNHGTQDELHAFGAEFYRDMKKAVAHRPSVPPYKQYKGGGMRRQPPCSVRH